MIYKRSKNLRASSSCSDISTYRARSDLGIEVDDALEISEQTEI